jgi:hypothetical protein
MKSENPTKTENKCPICGKVLMTTIPSDTGYKMIVPPGGLPIRPVNKEKGIVALLCQKEGCGGELLMQWNFLAGASNQPKK